MKDQLTLLRERAELIQESTSKKLIVNKNSYREVKKQIELHKIELEIQNEDLITSQTRLHSTLENYKDLYDLAPIPYFTLTKQGIIKELNEAASVLLGIIKTALINQNLARYIAPNFQFNFLSARNHVIKNKTSENVILKLVKRNNPLLEVELIMKTISTEKQKQILCIVLEKNKRPHDHSLELYNILAHELTHPVTIVNNYLQGCKRRLKNKSIEHDEFIQVIDKAIHQSERVSKILLRMKDFQCENVLHYETACINELIFETIEYIKHEAETNKIKLIIRPAPSLPKQNFDKLLMQQVILNLTRNAIEAIRDDNRNDGVIILEINQVKKSLIEVLVKDNGPGVSNEHKSNLFNLNVTTKFYGMGVGLAICKSIIEAHGGKITFEENPNGGTCFKFTIKVTPREK